MKARIVSERHRETQTWYELRFNYTNPEWSDGWMGFPCDEQGNVEKDTSAPWWSNYLSCMENKEGRYKKPFIEKRESCYTENAVMQCSCGEKFELCNEYLGTCQCPKCGQWYNLFGQELLPPEMWEEQIENDY